MRLRPQRGFSLIESLVAAGIAFAIGWQLLTVFHAIALGARRLDDGVRARAAIVHLEERIEADAAGAWSVFVPPVDVLGGGDADGHEVDFVTEDAGHNTYWWAYRFDAAAHRVTAYAYAPGIAATAGETFDGISAFSARPHSVSDLRDRGSDAYDPLFAGASATPAVVRYGWNPIAAGGNGLVWVRATAAGRTRETVLAAGTAPSRFTVVVEYTPPAAAPSP